MKISIQGYKGSFHDVVAGKVFGAQSPRNKTNDQIELLERSTFREVFDDVREGRADFAVAAIENSIAGAILQNFDLLRDSGLKVIGEYYLRIVHNLMALPGTKISDLKEVWSHPMALKQCQEFLLQYPNIKQVETDDTARSAAMIKESGQTNVAAIASSLAAEIHGMEILAPGIEDDPQNYTRFLIIAPQDYKQESVSTETIKTSSYIETAHKPGGLLPVLQTLQNFNANMTMLVSRPVIGKAWEYGFYVDFICAKDDLSKLQAEVEKVCDKFTILGSYQPMNG